MGILRRLKTVVVCDDDRRRKVHNSNTAVNSPVVEVTTDYDGHGDTTVVEVTTYYDGCLPRTVVEGSYHYNGVLLRTTVVRDGVNTTTVTSVHGWICWVNDYSEVACWVSTEERQAARIRGLYLRAILRQDISFFDKETNTGEVVGRMSGDTLLIQESLGEKVRKFIQCVACFLGRLVIAFIKGWLLTLVLLSCIPPLVIFGSMMSFTFAMLPSRGQAAYSEAATIVERTIDSI
ncbi:hypothetical protein JHK87_031010 [Glycine soja]|nr:hypothetical protein JHK87_031010 [Glycine soja]